MATATDIGAMIAFRRGATGERPCVAGTGVTVRRVAQLHQQGQTPEEISAGFGHISRAQVHAALAYYFANQAEIDGDLSAEAAAYEAALVESGLPHRA